MLDRRAFLRVLLPRVGSAVGAFALGVLVDAVWARVVRGPAPGRENHPRLLLGPFRVHHNVVGYLLALAGLFLYPVVLIPLGVGMIVGHGIRDRRFWFVERVD